MKAIGVRAIDAIMQFIERVFSLLEKLVDMIRWNLVACLLALVIITWRLFDFAEGILKSNDLITGNEDVILVGIFSLLTSAISGLVGYTMGLKEALTKDNGNN